MVKIKRIVPKICSRTNTHTHTHTHTHTQTHAQTDVRENVCNNSKNVKTHIFWILNIKNVRTVSEATLSLQSAVTESQYR